MSEARRANGGGRVLREEAASPLPTSDYVADGGLPLMSGMYRGRWSRAGSGE